MSRQPNITYLGWEIVPFVYPDEHGKWQATCEVERDSLSGREVMQGISGTFAGDTKEAAIAAASDDAKQKIDNIAADPLRK